MYMYTISAAHSLVWRWLVYRGGHSDAVLAVDNWWYVVGGGCQIYSHFYCPFCSQSIVKYFGVILGVYRQMIFTNLFLTYGGLGYPGDHTKSLVSFLTQFINGIPCGRVAIFVDMGGFVQL
jgi:hypothetical protein